jgi:hypothetical protein
LDDLTRIIIAQNANITDVNDKPFKGEFTMTSVLSTFDKWKSFLSERVEEAKSKGMGEETIEKLAFQIGEFLDNKVDPKNDEERVLKELWDIGDKDERKTIARLMVKLVEKG